MERKQGALKERISRFIIHGTLALAVLLIPLALYHENGEIDEAAGKFLEAQGYLDVTLTGKGRIEDCGASVGKRDRTDFYRTAFEAATPKGAHVKGVVCKGGKASDVNRIIIISETSPL